MANFMNNHMLPIVHIEQNYEELMKKEWSNLLYNFINQNLKDYNDIVWLSSNNDILAETVREHPYLLDNGFRITFNKNFDINWLFYFNKIKFHMTELSMNSSINLYTIKKYHTINWDPEGLALNPNMTISFVIENPHLNIKIEDLCKNMNLGVNCIMKIFNHPNTDYEYLSKNENLNDNFILNFINKHWNWNYLFCNRGMSPLFLAKYCKFVTDWEYVLTRSPMICELINLIHSNLFDTLDLNYLLSCNIYYPIQKINLNKRININDLSSNKTLSFSIIKRFNNLKWNSFNISANEVFDMKAIQHNMKHFKFNVRGLEHNRNLTFKFIIKNSNKFDWDFKNLALLDFKKERETFFHNFKEISFKYNQCY